jgi:hypothetical protein
MSQPSKKTKPKTKSFSEQVGALRNLPKFFRMI